VPSYWDGAAESIHTFIIRSATAGEPMTPADLCFAGAAEQARLVREGDVSATELIEATLARIEAIDPQINSYSVVFGDEALQAARDADARRIEGGDPLPMLGVPIAVKDNIALAGQTTNWGTSAVTAVAAEDAPLIARLRSAGAIIVGKTNCSELAVWPFTETPAWGATRNPWDLAFSPGGSSGGSGAAVAAGLCGLAVGSDGLGSVRVPSSFCGVFGLKPQRDRVWHESGGGGWYGLSVNGPLCRSVADAALFLDVADTGEAPTSFGRSLIDPLPHPLRIAVAWNSAAMFPVAARIGIAVKPMRRNVFR
jgi:amidase